MQRLYRDYMLAIDRTLAPVLLGLAAETNLIRAAAPALYPSVRQAANDTAAALRAAGSSTPLAASVQVEVAWGRLGGNGGYAGIDTDFADFPFVQTLGLSSYLYFRLHRARGRAAGLLHAACSGARRLPVMVMEGGWPSVGVGIDRLLQKQVRYVTRQAQLVDAAGATRRGCTCCSPTSTWPRCRSRCRPTCLATIGLADSNFTPKPALAAWDNLPARPRA
ncbi:MAG: hypothetical protein U1F67_03650 [Rubrivivax sp.]